MVLPLKKKIAHITIGAIILPKSSPNLIHNKFNGFKKFGFNKAKIKKIKAKTRDQIRGD